GVYVQYSLIPNLEPTMRLHVITLPLLLGALATSAPAPTTLPADPPPPPPQTLNPLIQSLRDPPFPQTQTASQELLKNSEPALPALREARKDKDPEIQQRAEAVIRDLTLLTAAQVEFNTTRANAAAAVGDFATAAQFQHIIARRYRPTINECVLLGH